jgi:hypothetical protein
MSVFSTGPGGGVYTKTLTDLLGIGASIDAQGRFVSRTGPAIRSVTANPNGVVSDYGGSLAMDTQNGLLYVNTSVGGAQTTSWLAASTAVGVAGAFGQFSDTSDQPLAANTPALVRFNTTDFANGVTVVDPGLGTGPTRLTVLVGGTYRFDLSLQMLNAGGGTATITFWPRLNGNNIPASASSIEMGNNNNRTLPYVPLFVQMNAGQYIEWVVLSTGANTSIEHFAAVVGPPAVPSIPSVIAGVFRLG